MSCRFPLAPWWSYAIMTPALTDDEKAALVAHLRHSLEYSRLRHGSTR
jgi:hypothetical protein